MTRVQVAAALVVAMALAESAVGLYAPRRVATPADWAAAAAHVRQGLRPDDLIVFAPAWIDQVGRHHLGDRMPIEMVARADSARYARIWELSVHGARAEETRVLAPVEERSFGHLTLRRYEQPLAKVLRDLTSDLADARATTRRRGGATEERPCTVEGDGRRCGGVRVERRVLEIDYRPRRGVLAPAPDGEVLTLAYDDVPAGTLVGFVGLHDYYARKSADGVVSFRVRVDEDASLIIPVRNPGREGEGWQRFELALAAGTHRVRFEIEADRPAHRLLGFHAEVRAP